MGQRWRVFAVAVGLGLSVAVPVGVAEAAHNPGHVVRACREAGVPGGNLWSLHCLFPEQANGTP